MRWLLPAVVVAATAALILSDVCRCGGRRVRAHEEVTPPAPPSPSQPVEPERTREVTPPEASSAPTVDQPRQGSEPSVTLEVRPKAPGDLTSSRVVYLAGRVSEEAVRRGVILRVTGIPQFYREDGRFEVRRSLPSPGRFTLAAVVSETKPLSGERVIGTADCEVRIPEDAGEDKSLRSLLTQLIGPAGEVHGIAFTTLIRSGDLRIAPALWKIIDADRGASGELRQRAIWTLGGMLHLDSVPRLIDLLNDDGAHRWAVSSLTRFGLFGEDGVVSSTAERGHLISVLHSEFKRREADLRRHLHQ